MKDLFYIYLAWLREHFPKKKEYKKVEVNDKTETNIYTELLEDSREFDITDKRR